MFHEMMIISIRDAHHPAAPGDGGPRISVPVRPSLAGRPGDERFEACAAEAVG
jgi:hypothetical protein